MWFIYKYKHFEMYEGIDVPEENKAWFVATEMEPTEQPLNLKPIRYSSEEEEGE